MFFHVYLFSLIIFETSHILTDSLFMQFVSPLSRTHPHPPTSLSLSLLSPEPATAPALLCSALYLLNDLKIASPFLSMLGKSYYSFLLIYLLILPLRDSFTLETLKLCFPSAIIARSRCKTVCLCAGLLRCSSPIPPPHPVPHFLEHNIR